MNKSSETRPAPGGFAIRRIGKHSQTVGYWSTREEAQAEVVRMNYCGGGVWRVEELPARSDDLRARGAR